MEAPVRPSGPGQQRVEPVDLRPPEIIRSTIRR